MTTIHIPAPCEFITANKRYHPQAKARLTKQWRLAARIAANGAGPQPTPARIVAYITKPRGGRWDPNNWADTSKACVDGLVDAGLFDDDSWQYITGPDHRRGGKGPASLTLTIHPWTGEQP
jgi:crossover junction endodeoxyribonuclease RusA